MHATLLALALAFVGLLVLLLAAGASVAADERRAARRPRP